MPPWPKKAKKTNRTQSGWAASGPGVEDSYPVWGSSAWAEPNSCWASSGSAQANSNAAWGDSTISWTASNVAWGDSHPGWDDSGPKWVSTSKSDWDIPNEEEVAQKLAEVDLSSQNRVEEEYRKNIEREELQEKLADWPWKNAPKQLLTLGPYLPNYYHRDPWALPKVEQTSKLFTLLIIDVIRHKILGWVIRDHFDGANFAMTCRSAFTHVSTEIGFWDISDGWFNNCERPRYGDGSSDKPALQGSVQSVLLVTPVRHPKKALAKGQPNIRGLYTRQISNVKTMLQALHNFADFLDNVQLHRVPFLTVELLNLVVPHMRNLRVLGVYKCQLIHIGHTLKLLDIIKEDRPLGKEDQVYLDFFPNYHVGPRDSDWSTGAYGVLWDNWGGDTRLAIWALVSRILPRAFAQGIDLTKPGTAFRKWLEMSPCWRVDDTLQAIVHPTLDPIQRVAWIDWPHYKGDVEYFTGNIFGRPEGWKWTTMYYTCASCKEDVLGIFYHFTEIRAGRQFGGLGGPNSNIRCMGCKLKADLDSETDHFKREKRHIITKWLREGEDEENPPFTLNTTDLSRALEDFDGKNITHDARQLDRLRRRLMRSSPVNERWDREFEERQRPRTRAMMGKHGSKLYAPAVGAYAAYAVKYTLSEEDLKWWSFDTRRYCMNSTAGMAFEQSALPRIGCSGLLFDMVCGGSVQSVVMVALTLGSLDVFPASLTLTNPFYFKIGVLGVGSLRAVLLWYFLWYSGF